MQRFYQNDGFNFATLIALGSAYRGLANVGEVLATIERIPDGDREAWVREWSATGDRLRAAADRDAKAEHRVSARTAYLRASLYYDLASSMAAGTSDPQRFDSLWETHRDCWDRAVALWSGVEPIRIPFEDTTLEGYWFSPPAADGQPRATVILNNGSDGPVIAMWSEGAAAVDRGWNAITFDGPGQGAALHRDHMPFRYDWEAVITPVVEFLVARDDVDASRIALHGVSQAGYWVPRAAAFEHRLAAAVADPGVLDVSSSWVAQLPKEVVAMLDDATISEIRCPVLLTDPDDEQFWPGQSRNLFEKLSGPKEIVHFTRNEGANWHCEVAAQSLRDERVFNWLEETFARVTN